MGPPLLIKSTPFSYHVGTGIAAKELIDAWLHTWDSTGNGLYVREESYLPPATDYFFVRLDGDTLTFVGFEQSLHANNYTMISATYSIDTWYLLDSLTAPFWIKPEMIPERFGVMDGGETEMIGIKDGQKHRVFSSNASVQDPEFNDVAKVISLHLFGNTIVITNPKDY